MADGVKVGADLVGWKEISAYLRVSVRTAQALEKERGLPVRRGAGLKGPVFAVASELDAWRLRPQSAPNETAVPLPPPEHLLTTRRPLLRYSVGAAALLAAGGLGYGVRFAFGHDSAPASYRVQGSTLIVFNRDDRELWRHRFQRELLLSNYTDLHGYGWEGCLFADLDGDGKIETLFRQMPRDLSGGERPLTCFDSKGKVRWEFVATRTVVDNLGRSFAPPFWPNNFQIFASKSGVAAQVVVISNHNWSFPTQVAVLDGRTGRLVTEYWHRGHLLHMAAADLDGDGEPQVLLGGVNDALEYKRATLVIFDHRNISGASKNPRGGVYFQGMNPGTEKKVVFFPRTAISMDIEFNQVSVVTVASGRIRVNVLESFDVGGPFVVYEFDFQLRPINVALSDRLMDRYRQLQDHGELPKESIRAITERLKTEITIL